MSYQEFEQIPETPQGFPYELRHGELVQMPPPNRTHYLVQLRMQQFLSNAAGNAGVVGTEMPFRPLPEFEYWQADVALVSRARWDQIPGERHLDGAPDLVVEVLSPSSTQPKCSTGGISAWGTAHVSFGWSTSSTAKWRSLRRTAIRSLTSPRSTSRFSFRPAQR